MTTITLTTADAIAPLAKVVPYKTAIHGDSRVDNYFWLRNREDPDTLEYLEAENRYTQSVMKPAAALEKKLYDEMLGRIKQTDLSVPTRRDDYFYYTRTEEGKQYAIYCRKHGSLDAPEEILLDEPSMAKGSGFFAVALQRGRRGEPTVSVSPRPSARSRGRSR